MNEVQSITRILIVDDEQELRLIYNELLVAEGYEVIQAASGNQAMEIIETGPIDLVITDLAMPNGNGLKVRDKARERAIPVIIVSAYDHAYSPLIGKDEIVVRKPVAFDVLMKTIERVCPKIVKPLA